MVVGRPKNNDFPPYMSVDGDRGGFAVRNPITGKKKRFPPDQEQQCRELAELLGAWVEKRRQKDLLDEGKPRIAYLIDRWIEEKMPHMPWDIETRKTAAFRLRRIRNEIGTKLIDEADCLFLKNWIEVAA